MMRWLAVTTGAAALFSLGMSRARRLSPDSPQLTEGVVTALGQSDTYCDSLGRCFAYYTNDVDITFGVAIPVAPKVPFDVIVQITAPKKVGWAGLAWGGTMTYNPLAVVWPNGTAAAISSRIAM